MPDRRVEDGRGEEEPREEQRFLDIERRLTEMLVLRHELVKAKLVGFTGGPMESKSYSIVGPGLDQSRAKYACPGLDHAAAYPIELLVVQEGSDVKVLLIDEMFRMKMYFEDAGKMKFAANMAMPGSIEDELRDLIEDAF